MLRSQSISNLNEQRRSKGSLFGGLRSRKHSMTDLQSTKISAPLTSTNLARKPRPLSNSVANTYKPDSESKQTTVSKSRLSISVENKENESPSIPKQKSLKSRSSAPNLQATQSKPSAKANRSSMILGNLISKPNVATTNTTIHADRSPITISSSPETMNTVDSLFDSTSIQFHDFENSTEIVDIDNVDTSSSSMESEKDTSKKSEYARRQVSYEIDTVAPLSPISATTMMSSKSRHRITRVFDADEFVKFMYSQNGPLENKKLPLNNRKSLEYEQFERSELITHLNREHKAKNQATHTSSLSLLENVLCLTTTSVSQTKGTFEDSINNIDFLSAIKEESYDDDDVSELINAGTETSDI